MSINTKAIVKMGLSEREVERVNRLDEALNRERLTQVKPVNREEREREWLQLFTQARAKAGISMTAAAIDMGGISVQLLSAQEAGAKDKHISFRRMWSLGPKFAAELVELILAYHGIDPPGLTAQDLEYLRIGKLEVEKQQLVLKAVNR